jgi:transcriptional regulator with XRE-family HTH domain
MSTRTFRELCEEARQRDTYWEERAVLEFTEEVYRRMEALGLNKTQLAGRLGTSAAYVTKVLGGDANFTLRTMVRLALALECHVHTHLVPAEGRVEMTGGKEPTEGYGDYPSGRETEFVPGAVAEASAVEKPISREPAPQRSRSMRTGAAKTKPSA